MFILTYHLVGKTNPRSVLSLCFSALVCGDNVLDKAGRGQLVAALAPASTAIHGTLSVCRWPKPVRLGFDKLSLVPDVSV